MVRDVAAGQSMTFPPAVGRWASSATRWPFAVARCGLSVLSGNRLGRRPSPVAQPLLTAGRGPLVPCHRPSAPQDRP